MGPKILMVTAISEFDSYDLLFLVTKTNSWNETCLKLANCFSPSTQKFLDLAWTWIEILFSSAKKDPDPHLSIQKIFDRARTWIELPFSSAKKDLDPHLSTQKFLDLAWTWIVKHL